MTLSNLVFLKSTSLINMSSRESYYSSKEEHDKNMKNNTYKEQFEDDKVAEDWLRNDKYYKNLWGLHGLHGIKAEEAWNTTIGNTNVKVGILENGLQADHDVGYFLEILLRIQMLLLYMELQ